MDQSLTCNRPIMAFKAIAALLFFALALGRVDEKILSLHTGCRLI
jgi:hypothetical protein